MNTVDKDFEERFDLQRQRYLIEDKQGWRKEISSIPFIQFPSNWKIQIIPPFGDAVVRFRVKLPSGKEKSIYLDSRESLGVYGDPLEPYWEVYPHHGDVVRCGINEVEKLLEYIGDDSEILI